MSRVLVIDDEPQILRALAVNLQIRGYGYPGVPGFGAKTAAALLRRFGHLDAIPDDPAAWGEQIRGASRLAATLRESTQAATLFRTLATLVTDIDLATATDDLEWTGPTADLPRVCAAYDAPASQDDQTPTGAPRHLGLDRTRVGAAQT